MAGMAQPPLHPRTAFGRPPAFRPALRLTAGATTLLPHEAGQSAGQRSSQDKESAMLRLILIAAAGSLAAVHAASAQEKVTAKSGEEVRAGWIGIVKKDCSTEPPPRVRPSDMAGHGQIRLSKAKVKTNSIEACPGVEVPAVIVFYTSQPGFRGEDQFTLQVGQGEKAQKRTYMVNVE
jgi:hypothetical protein